MHMYQDSFNIISPVFGYGRMYEFKVRMLMLGFSPFIVLRSLNM